MSLISPIYQGNHCLPVNKKSACTLSRKKKATKQILASSNTRVHRSVNFQQRIDLVVSQRKSGFAL